jgi:hypothetical protein
MVYGPQDPDDPFSYHVGVTVTLVFPKLDRSNWILCRPERLGSKVIGVTYSSLSISSARDQLLESPLQLKSLLYKGAANALVMLTDSKMTLITILKTVFSLSESLPCVCE